MNVAFPDVRVPVNGWHGVAALIDHTLLKPEATREEITHACEEAMRYGFHAVFVNPNMLAQASSVLRGSGVKPGTPIGFPLGVALTTVKLFETTEALKLGAEEIDMVIAIGALKAGDQQFVKSDIRAVAQVAHDGGALLKVILETALLDDKEKILACALAMEAGADFVKTSTGFNGGGATPQDVHLMRGVVGSKLGVKASGGIRTVVDLERMVEAGANRIGTHASVAIVRELGAPE